MAGTTWRTSPGCASGRAGEVNGRGQGTGDRGQPADGLRERLLEVIARGARAPMGDAELDGLAREVFAHQYVCNAPYRAFCDRRGVTPETVGGWMDVPAVPTDAF